MGVLVDWMIGWHQGGAEKHERQARHHREAERRWRDRDRPDPYECRASSGRSFGTHSEAYEWYAGYVTWATDRGARVLETPEVFRCYDGHIHVKLALDWPTRPLGGRSRWTAGVAMLTGTIAGLDRGEGKVYPIYRIGRTDGTWEDWGLTNRDRVGTLTRDVQAGEGLVPDDFMELRQHTAVGTTYPFGSGQQGPEPTG